MLSFLHSPHSEILWIVGDKSGARINISEGSCPERIITISGPTDCVFRAFTMITFKLEEVVTTETNPCIHLNKSICTYIMAKKMTETTESWSCVSIVCVVWLCCMSPPKGATIPYRPSPTPGSVLLGGTQVFEASDFGSHPLFSMVQGGVDLQQVSISARARLHSSFLVSASMESNSQTSQEFIIPNDLIGSIIGRQGSKINEIRQVSGAQIKIGSQIDSTSDRHVTITGTPIAINLAQYLITSCLETAKSTAQSSSMPSPVDLTMSFTQPSPPASASSSSSSPLAAMGATLPHAPMLGAPYALPLSSLLGVKSIPYLALSTSSASAAAAAASSVPTAATATVPVSAHTAAALASYTAKISSSANSMKKPERQKFAPY
uniref:Poly(rC) binding protein 4 n=1 Tax=Oryzias sinensis TaxID=183150 RepID=A0A8C7Y088_9TELE